MLTKINTLNRNHVIIIKDNIALHVVKDGKCLIAVNAHARVDGIPFVPYVYIGEGPDDTYQKMLHFIGKMILKDTDSKYFGNPIFNEHIKNGRPDKVFEEHVIHMAMDAVKRGTGDK